MRCLNHIQRFWYFAEKSADFAGFSRKKSQNSQKKSADFADFSGKNSNFEGFSGANYSENRPISREISGGNFAKKQSVKKQPISLDFFWQISLKSINFASVWPALFNVFLTGVIICAFNNSSLEKWANAKAINVMVSAQFFTTLI